MGLDEASRGQLDRSKQRLDQLEEEVAEQRKQLQKTDSDLRLFTSSSIDSRLEELKRSFDRQLNDQGVELD